METTSMTKATRPATKRAAASTPSREAIEWRAYELWLERGGFDGSELEDWLKAEQELSSAKAARKSKAA